MSLKSLPLQSALTLTVKLASFGLNQYLITKGLVSSEHFGIVYGLADVYKDALFGVFREVWRFIGVRYVLSISSSIDQSKRDLSQSEQDQRQKQIDLRQYIVNLGWVSTLLCSLIALTSLLVMQKWYPRSLSHDTQLLYQSYVVSIIIEMLAEPILMFNQSLGNINTKVAIETAANLVRASSVSLLIVHYRLPPLQAYSYAQILSGICICFGWILSSFYFQSLPIGIFLPRSVIYSVKDHQKSAFLQQEMWILLRPLGLQMFVKYLVGESDKIIMSQLGSDSQRGLYALISNYVSLVVRVLFLPVEDICRSMLARSKQNLAHTQLVLQTVLRGYFYLGTLIVAYGWLYSPAVIKLVLGSTWAKDSEVATNILKAYCFFLPLLAINGVSEAFVHIFADEQQMNTSTMFFFASGFVNYILGWSMFRFDVGVVGIVIVNCVSAILRLARNWQVISSHISAQSVLTNSSQLHLVTFSMMVLLYSVSVYSVQQLSSLYSLASGAICGALSLLSIFVFDRQFRGDLKRL
ncbi:hypothetical protein MP228_008086 [Amoeboaphelidium protococcarum]|nr:hypothetical protein MP228_008086 [Amoeboaphelidium protococcarum]